MNTHNCPKIDKCPIFLANVLNNNNVGSAYRNVYCLAGEHKYTTCTRYLLSQKLNIPIPANILPNNRLPLEKLIEKINAMHKVY